VALILFVAYLTSVNNEKIRDIVVLDRSGLFNETLVSTKQTKYQIVESMDLQSAKSLANDTKAYGLLYVPKMALDSISDNIKFYSEDSPSLTFITGLESKIENRLKELKLREAGVDLYKIKAAKTNVNLNQESYKGVKTSKAGSAMKLMFGGAAGYLLFMFIIIYGNLIMRSVIEEKTSRIIEVIISSVKPIQLMLGKIFGTSLAGLTQFVIWILLGFTMLLVVTSVFGVDLTPVQAPQQEIMNNAVAQSTASTDIQNIILEFYTLPIGNLIIAFVLFFIGGYLLYSSLYAAIGAAVDNETDTQQFLFPILMPLILAVYVGVFTVIEDPHGTISTVFSYIPFTSPVVMLMRIPFGVPLWEQILSLFILGTTFVFTVWFAAKIYRVGILMYGKKPTYKELLKWLKY
jgi:ABC-2 type transport system permease protein